MDTGAMLPTDDHFKYSRRQIDRMLKIELLQRDYQIEEADFDLAMVWFVLQHYCPAGFCYFPIRPTTGAVNAKFKPRAIKSGKLRAKSFV